MKNFTLGLFLLFFLFQTNTYSQIKVVTGGNVRMNDAPLNSSVYTVIGHHIQIQGARLSIYGYHGATLNMNHQAINKVNHQWGSYINVDNQTTKCWITAYNGFHNFYVDGYGIAWSYYGFGKLSDSTVKFDINPMSNALSIINQMNPIYYRLKPSSLGLTDSTILDSFNTQRRQIGFIAQELELILPEVVYKTHPDSTTIDSASLADSLTVDSTGKQLYKKGIDYGSIVALLTQGIKEQQAEIIGTKAQVSSDSASIVSLTNSVMLNTAQISGLQARLDQVSNDSITILGLQSRLDQITNDSVNIININGRLYQIGTDSSSVINLNTSISDLTILVNNLQSRLDVCCPAEGGRPGGDEGGNNFNGINGSGSYVLVNKLYQNIPNPFTIETKISYDIILKSKTAAIYIYDMEGKQIKKIAINEFGKSSIAINGKELAAGMYMYSLIVDGKEIDTKRMILTAD